MAPPLPAGPFAASPCVRRLTVGERQVLFCERRQQLFELDAASAVIWDRLAAGAAEASGLDSCGPVEVIEASLRHWLEGGWLTPQSLAERCSEPGAHVLPLRLGDLAARVELRDNGADELRRSLQQAFGQFIAPDVAQAVRLDVVADAGGFFVLRRGLPVSLLAPDRVVPELKALLTEELCSLPADGGLLLHAALLESRGRGLLLAGQPGAGKTTLTVALATRGLSYATDDLVRVSPSGGFQGIPFSPALKTGGWPLLGSYVPGLHELAIHRRADGQDVRYLPAQRLTAAAMATPEWAVLLDRRDGADAQLQPVDPLSAMSELLGGAFTADHRLRGDTLAALARQFSQMQCRRLVYSQLADAVAVLEGLLDE
jgi:hypothetical protein